ncbi:prolipoprotein diacylglyceryl transferase [Paenibacillus sp. MMS20-IR301]|uniref:prolipoprotein diacylglyceryl transferase n=1 Tax=Paenibacillus sp. MMS20-IR301 TaxID=2895946 RepID=UPI0028E94A68|nr:prolipoprotein diacylglyceryl transferase [Paenibacillus sp. MMS20-IR301]WNS47019.1 prolipoprotein diacylglyceryl transferase [Paenibacillus sp. MMS20-IR301]
MYLQLNKIAFSLGAINIHWYGLILGMAALIGLLFVIYEGKKRFNIPQEVFMDMLLLGLPSAIIGARIYYIVFKWDDYRDNIWGVFKIWNGGIAIYGALIGAVVFAVIFFRKKGYSFWRMADICAPGLIVGQLIGRWGNYVNQEAYGGPVEETFLIEKLHLPDFIVNQMEIEGVFHHPTFLYESFWNLVGLILLLILRRQKFLRSGELFMSYFIWYSAGRFFIEALRTDSLGFQSPSWIPYIVNGLWSPMMSLGFEQGYLDPVYGNVRISQLLALFIIIIAITLIVVRRVTGKTTSLYSDPIVPIKAASHI